MNYLYPTGEVITFSEIHIGLTSTKYGEVKTFTSILAMMGEKIISVILSIIYWVILALFRFLVFQKPL